MFRAVTSSSQSVTTVTRRQCFAGPSVCRNRAFSGVARGDESNWEYHHDVLVVGGGIVGCSLACRLAQDAAGGGPKATPKRAVVGLIEARPPRPLSAALARDSPDPRVYSLTPASVRLLKNVGVWDGLGGGGLGGGASGALGVIKERSQPFGGMQVWDDRGTGHLCFGGDASAGESLGFISEHGVIHSALFERVQELQSTGLAELTCPAQVKGVTFPSKGAGGNSGPMTVTIEDSEGNLKKITCRLLVAADGGDSKVAKMLGLPSWGWGYGQRAVVATVRLSHSYGQTAFQRYLARGPLAMLPLQGDRASLVWSTTPEHAEHLKRLTETEFLQVVNDALQLPASVGKSSERSDHYPEHSASGAAASAASQRGGGMGPFSGLFTAGPSTFAFANPLTVASSLAGGFVNGVERIGGALGGLSMAIGGSSGGEFSTPPEAVEVLTPRLGFDLSLRQAHRYTGERAALVGDAAHTIHPMAGQGLNLGIADADALARAVLDGRQSGMDVGSPTLLTRYENERKTDALVMMGALDSLHRIFGAEGRAAAAIRNAGLSALNVAEPIKRRLALHAMGGGAGGA